MSFNPTLSIIIVSYNTKKLTKECLDSIVKYDRRLDFSGKEVASHKEEIIPAEIIVVDNDSRDGSREFLKKWEKGKGNFKVIYSPKNIGFGGGNNLGMKVARGEYFLLLNSDTLLAQAAISQTLFWLSSRPEFDVVACRLLNQDKTFQENTGRFPTLINVFSMLYLDPLFKKQTTMNSPTQVKAVDWIMGAFMLLRKDVYRQAGGFDEKIFMYMEEVEWCYRIKKAGFAVGFYPGASVFHLKGASSSTRTEPIVYIFQGLAYFYQKHFPKTSFFALKLMLNIKALSSWFLGRLIKKKYLIDTYSQAYRAVKKEGKGEKR